MLILSPLTPSSLPLYLAPSYPSPYFPAALPSAVLTLMFSPYQRGIYCDDESIRYPYRRDTISHRAMAAVTITSSIVIVSLMNNLMIMYKMARYGTSLPLLCYEFASLSIDNYRRSVPGVLQASPLQL